MTKEQTIRLLDLLISYTPLGATYNFFKSLYAIFHKNKNARDKFFDELINSISELTQYSDDSNSVVDKVFHTCKDINATMIVESFGNHNILKQKLIANNEFFNSETEYNDPEFIIYKRDINAVVDSIYKNLNVFDIDSEILIQLLKNSNENTNALDEIKDNINIGFDNIKEKINDLKCEVIFEKTSVNSTDSSADTKNWSHNLALTWHNMLPPSRPSKSEIEIYREYFREIKEKNTHMNSKVLILGTTNEFRKLSLEEGFETYIVDYSYEYYKEISSELDSNDLARLQNNEKLINIKWENMGESDDLLKNSFDIVIGDSYW